MDFQRLLELHRRRIGFEPDLRARPIQSGMRGDPWRISVCCMCLNQASGRALRPLLPRIFGIYPRPIHAADAENLPQILKPLGLQVVRATRLKAMSRAFVDGTETSTNRVCGIGPYAEEALRIFALGDTDFTPADRILRAYLAGDRSMAC